MIALVQGEVLQARTTLAHVHDLPYSVWGARACSAELGAKFHSLS